MRCLQATEKTVYVELLPVASEYVREEPHPVNRGFNSVIDATVHATRYVYSKDERLRDLIEYHLGIVAKCGGPLAARRSLASLSQTQRACRRGSAPPGLAAAEAVPAGKDLPLVLRENPVRRRGICESEDMNSSGYNPRHRQGCCHQTHTVKNSAADICSNAKNCGGERRNALSL